jgi:microcystin-dependent protein
MDVLFGNIMCFAFPFAPHNWLECNGQTLNIATYQTLYSLLGTTFGGNGSTTFCLPNLNGSSRLNGYMKFYIANEGYYPSRS